MRTVLLALVAVLAAACASEASSPPTSSNDEIKSAPTAAPESLHFDCTSDAKIEDATQHLEFGIKGVTDEKTFAFVDPEQTDSPIKVTPEDGTVAMINENYQTESTSEQLHIHGDADGLAFIDLILYADHHYEKGYVRISGDDGDGYSTVSCKVTPL